MAGAVEQRSTREARRWLTGTQPRPAQMERLPRFLGAAYYGELMFGAGGEGVPVAGAQREKEEARRRVLVAYASRMGSTREIAEAVGAEITRAGLAVDVRPAADVIDVEPYAAVVVGSALYFARWRPPAVRLLRRHGRALRARPVWLFQSGPVGDTGASSGRPSHPAPRVVRRLAARIGADLPVTFGGALTPERAQGLLARRIVARGVSGDSRDFDDIRAWARELAGQVLSSAVPR
jgi:menaquinone-dependent protoporphyrinogen oxidase